MKIAKHFEFEAAHQLPDKEIYGKCRYPHGHRYELLVEVKGDVNGDGWVANFSEIKAIVNEKVVSKYDHANLNDFFEISTAENIILKIWKDLSQAFTGKPYSLSKIRLYETSKSYAELEA